MAHDYPNETLIDEALDYHAQEGEPHANRYGYTQPVLVYEDVRRDVNNQEDDHIGDAQQGYRCRSIPVTIFNCASDGLQRDPCHLIAQGRKAIQSQFKVPVFVKDVF